MNEAPQRKLKCEDWRRHWEAWKSSGQSQAAYSRQHQLPVHAFRYWITKFNQPANSPSTTALVKLPLRAQSVRESALEVVVGEKYRLLIRAGFDAGLLQAVLSSLEKQPWL